MGAVVSQRFSGRFWLPGAPDRTVGGWLDTSERWPVVELAEPLTPSMREVSRTPKPNGSYEVVYEPADDDLQPDTVTLHGLVREPQPRRVTLVDAINTGRQETWGTGFADPGMERLQARYALIGGHVDDPDACFTEARLQLRQLDVWAQLPGIRTEIARDGGHARAILDRPDEETTELTNPAGRLILGSVLTAPRPTVRGVSFTRTAQLRWQSEGAGLTVDQLWARLVDPLRTLLTLAVDADSPPVSLEVRSTTEERWLQVFHPGLDAPEPELLPAHLVLLTRDELGLEQLGRWLARAAALSPVPQLVAGVALPEARRPVEIQLLELAAAAEGLHRRLHPDHQVMSKGQARQARRDASNGVLAEVRAQVTDRLGHLEEPTYMQRLTLLAEQGSPAAAGVTGATEQWARMIRDSRNGFAHLLDASKGREVEVEEHLVLLRSLRWLLTSLLLLEAGTGPDALAARLEQHDAYIRFQRQARRWLPAVYSV